MDLRDAEVASLVDREDCWPEKGKLKLDGFAYGRFAEGTLREAPRRRDWLDRQPQEDLRGNFKPQPFQQLVKVLKEAGHSKEARKIAIREQELLTSGVRFKSRPFEWLWRRFLDISIRYGYMPERIIIAAVAVWLICGVVYKLGEDQRIFAPTNAAYFLHKKVEDCRAADKQNSANCYLENGPEYPSFDPFVFSLDVILPVVNLHQKDAWQPMDRPLEIRVANRSFPFLPIRLVTWLETLLGWVAAIMLTAFVGGVIKKE